MGVLDRSRPAKLGSAATRQTGQAGHRGWDMALHAKNCGPRIICQLSQPCPNKDPNSKQVKAHDRFMTRIFCRAMLAGSTKATKQLHPGLLANELPRKKHIDSVHSAYSWIALHGGCRPMEPKEIVLSFLSKTIHSYCVFFLLSVVLFCNLYIWIKQIELQYQSKTKHRGFSCKFQRRLRIFTSNGLGGSGGPSPTTGHTLAHWSMLVWQLNCDHFIQLHNVLNQWTLD